MLTRSSPHYLLWICNNPKWNTLDSIFNVMQLHEHSVYMKSFSEIFQNFLVFLCLRWMQTQEYIQFNTHFLSPPPNLNHTVHCVTKFWRGYSGQNTSQKQNKYKRWYSTMVKWGAYLSQRMNVVGRQRLLVIALRPLKSCPILSQLQHVCIWSNMRVPLCLLSKKNKSGGEKEQKNNKKRMVNLSWYSTGMSLEGS